MKKLAILILGVMLVMPMVAQEPEAKTQWVLDDISKIALQAFHQRYQEDYLELIKVIKKAEMKINPDMPAEAVFNDQLQAFVIPKKQEEKKQ